MIGEQDIEVWSRNSFADLSRSKQTLEEAHQPINPRFFSYLNNVAFPNSYPFIKTAYYLTTTTTTATEIVTCLSTAIFSVPASSLWTVICRKRRDIVELFEGLKSLDEEEESIIPSKLQP